MDSSDDPGIPTGKDGVSDDLIASDTSPRIRPGATVTLHFSLLLKSGEEIDSTRKGDPATFVVGDGNLLPGFEEALLGKSAGYADQIELQPEQAFGERREENVRLLPRQRFSDIDDALEPGLMVSFNSPEGELPGVVQEVYAETLRVDFNHPLSGRVIVFDVAIINVE